MFENAIVRKPGHSLVNGITSTPKLEKPNYEIALKQHDTYIEALEFCGVKVAILQADERFPNSCFVEDVAVCTKKFAMIARPGTTSRKGEEKEIIGAIKNIIITLNI